VLINEKTWQGLTEAQRAAMSKAARRVEKELRNEMGKLEQASFDAVRGKIKIIELTPAQMKDWQESTASVVDTFVKGAGPLGKQLVEAAKKL
jgi:C4-dicarboxylate-binding protein DctP